MSLGDMPSRSVFLETQGKKKSVGMRGFGIRQLANQTYFQKLIYMGETNLWEVIRHMFVVSGKPARTPRKAFEVQKVFAFAPPHILCSLCCVWHLPPTDKLLDFLPFFFLLLLLLLFFLDLLKPVHLHFKHVKEMASVSAAVTVFGRQAGDVCLCDTDTEYTSPQIPPCSMCYKVLEHKWGRRGKDRSSLCRVSFFFL